MGLESRGIVLSVSEKKALISFAVGFTVTAKLICVFVIAYAECWFCHEGAQMPVGIGQHLKPIVVMCACSRSFHCVSS